MLGPQFQHPIFKDVITPPKLHKERISKSALQQVPTPGPTNAIKEQPDPKAQPPPSIHKSEPLIIEPIILR